MYLSLALLYIVALFSSSTAQSTCDPELLCLTRQSQRILDKMLPGIPDLVKPLEPLQLDLVLGKTSDLDYALSSVVLTGLKDCKVELLSIHPTDLTFLYILKSPQFLITSDYKVNGSLDSHPIDHEGSLQVTFDDYRVIMKGVDATYDDKVDNKTRMYMTKFHVDDETFEKVKVDSKSVREADKEKANLFLTSFEKQLGSADRTIPSPLTEKIWQKYMDELNIYLKAIPHQKIRE